MKSWDESPSLYSSDIFVVFCSPGLISVRDPSQKSCRISSSWSALNDTGVPIAGGSCWYKHRSPTSSVKFALPSMNGKIVGHEPLQPVSVSV